MTTARLVVSAIIDGDGGVALLPRADLLRGRNGYMQSSDVSRNNNVFERGVRWNAVGECDFWNSWSTRYCPSRVRRGEIKAVIWVRVHDANTANLGSSRRHLDSG